MILEIPVVVSSAVTEAVTLVRVSDPGQEQEAFVLLGVLHTVAGHRLRDAEFAGREVIEGTDILELQLAVIHAFRNGNTLAVAPCLLDQKMSVHFRAE